MKSKAADSLPWPLLVGAKFLQVHPVGTISAILLALPGQIALIASFLLPIKIVMLMASDGMPRFMPSLAADLDKKMVIGLLAGLSIASFIFHHLTNKAIQAIARSGVSRLEKRNQKLKLFDGQEEFTRNSYTRYIDTVASVNFVLLGTILLLVIYPEVAFTFTGYIALCIIGASIAKHLTHSDTDVFSISIQKKLPNLAGIGFILIFLWVLADYLFLSVPNSFIALLVSVILGRQLLTRTSLIANSLFFFSQQKQKLRAVLFHREVFQPVRKQNNSIWDFLDTSASSYRELQQHLRSIFNSSGSDAKLTWHDSGVPGIGIMAATSDYSDRTLLVKIFEKSKTTDACHEAALLLDAPETLPCPPMIANTVVTGHFIHISDITDYSFALTASPQHTKNRLSLSLSEVAPPNRLLARYLRSHSMLWDQLGELQRQQLELISKDTITIATFFSKLEQIRDELKSLPLRINNPQLGNGNLRIQSPDGHIQFLHWGRWTLEPLGAGLSRAEVNEITNKTGTSPGGDNIGTDGEHSRNPRPIVAYLSRQLIIQSQKQLFLEAIETIKDLNKFFGEPSNVY